MSTPSTLVGNGNVAKGNNKIILKKINKFFGDDEVNRLYVKEQSI